MSRRAVRRAFIAGLKVVFISRSGSNWKAHELLQDPLGYHSEVI
jgi:hypothetical protein